MVEFIGAAAAIPQLAKYSFSAFNTIPDLHRRVQKAPTTLRQWHDDASLLVSLAQSYQVQPCLVGSVSCGIIDRFSENAEDLRASFQKYLVVSADGKLSKLRKSIGVVRKEKEFNQAMTSVIQRNTLISSCLLAYVCFRESSSVTPADYHSNAVTSNFGLVSILPMTANPSSSMFGPVACNSHQCFSHVPAVASQTTEASELLSVLACLDQTNLDHHVLSRVATTIEAKQSLTVLKSSHLLKPTQSGHTWQIEVLTGKTIESLLPTDPRRNHIVASALRTVASLLTIDCDERQYQPSNQDFKHASCALMALISFAAETDVQPEVIALVVAVATKVCQHLVTISQASRAIKLVQQILSWGHTTIPALRQPANKLRSKLGAAYHSNGLFEHAVSITQTALHVQCRIDENHVDTLHSLNNMGVVYQDQGRYAIAESYHSKALEMKQRIFGVQHAEIYITLNNLALALQSQKKFGEAEGIHRRALRGRKRLLPSSHPDTLVSMSNLGVLMHAQGRLVEAQIFHEAALEGRERVLGVDHPEMIKSKGNVALVLERKGQPDRAIAMLREVCQTYKQTLGSSHPDTIRSLRNLAIFLHRQGKTDEAADLMQEALDALEEKFGKGHVETFNTQQYLATLLHGQGKLDDALDIVAWLYDMRNETLGREHPDTVCSRTHLEELEAELTQAGRGSIVVVSRMI
jgi:tetratricopeptide (TPR) repeat protein